MNMKKWISIALVLAIVIGIMCFAGCREEAPTQPNLSLDPTSPALPDSTGSQNTNDPTEPPADGPNEPEVSQPTYTEPVSTRPVEPTEPGQTEPEATEPEETQPEATEPTTEPEATEPEATDPPATQPTPTDPPEVSLGFAEYLEMSPEEQEDFFTSFENPQDFFNWLNAAQKQYEETKDQIEVGGDETFDLGNLPE